MTASNLGYSPVAVSDGAPLEVSHTLAHGTYGILSTDEKRTDDAMTNIGDHAILKPHAE